MKFDFIGCEYVVGVEVLHVVTAGDGEAVIAGVVRMRSPIRFS